MSSSPKPDQLLPEDVTVTSHGPVPDGMADHAKEQVSHATRLSGRDVLGARVTLVQRTNPTITELSRAEVELDISGMPLRAEARGLTTAQALDGVIGQIERLIVDLANRGDDRARWPDAVQDGQWKRGDLAAERTEPFPRPIEERDVVRRKAIAVSPSTAQEAAYDMEALGHDFHLFTDAATGSPALVHRRSDGSYGVSGLDDQVAEIGGLVPESAPPTISEASARQRLDASGEPFVFYIDETSGQGSVVYLRHDGHYGVISAS